MIRVGLIGEDPNDTDAIKALLLQRYDVQFIKLLRNKKGSQLDTDVVENILRVEWKSAKPDAVIFIRDADGINTETEKIQKRKDWFEKLGKVIDGKKTLLLNIYSLEALILADIETFNKEYTTTLKSIGDVSMIEAPKKYLMQKTEKSRKKYAEHHCPQLFSKLRFDVVHSNCKYFREFNAAFKKLIA